MKISDRVKYYSEKKNPLSKHGIRAFFEHYVSIMPSLEQESKVFEKKLPLLRCNRDITSRNSLSNRQVQKVEDARVNEVMKKTVLEKIDRVQAVFNRYNITIRSQVFNMYQSGMSFKKIVGKSLRKGFVESSKNKKNSVVQMIIEAKGKLGKSHDNAGC